MGDPGERESETYIFHSIKCQCVTESPRYSRSPSAGLIVAPFSARPRAVTFFNLTGMLGFSSGGRLLNESGQCKCSRWFQVMCGDVLGEYCWACPSLAKEWFPVPHCPVYADRLLAHPLVSYLYLDRRRGNKLQEIFSMEACCALFGLRERYLQLQIFSQFFILNGDQVK